MLNLLKLPQKKEEQGTGGLRVGIRLCNRLQSEENAPRKYVPSFFLFRESNGASVTIHNKSIEWLFIMPCYVIFPEQKKPGSFTLTTKMQTITLLWLNLPDWTGVMQRIRILPRLMARGLKSLH